MVVKKSVAMSGVVAGETAISTVDEEGGGLTYRGYSIQDLAEHVTFEEVAYLLIHGELPDQARLDSYKEKLVGMRSLPDQLKTVLEQIPATAHPMDVLRTGCSALGTMAPEGPENDQREVADRLIASFPSMLLYWHHFSERSER